MLTLPNISRIQLKPIKVTFLEMREKPEMIDIIRQCWAESPQDRPSFDEINKMVTKLRGGRYNYQAT